MNSKLFITIGLTIWVCQLLLDSEGVMANMLPNPERPMKATTCKEALKRVREAALGNSLVDREQNRRHLQEALAQAEQLCFDKDADKND